MRGAKVERGVSCLSICLTNKLASQGCHGTSRIAGEITVSSYLLVIGRVSISGGAALADGPPLLSVPIFFLGSQGCC